MSGKAKLIEGPVGGTLLSLALPMTFGIVFLILLSLIDTYFVAMLGTAELAAMSFTFPVITLVISVSLGLSVGTTSAVSRALGAGDDRAVRRLTTHAVLLSVLIVAVISTGGVLSQKWVFTQLGAEPELIPLLEEYMTIWFIGSVFLVVPMVANGVLRAGGDAKTPMYLMIVAAIVNGVLDPLFIFGYAGFPELGLAGAAIATLIARSVTLVAAFYVLIKQNALDLHVPTLAELFDSWRKVVSVGVPAAITNALGPVATAVMTALIAREGHEAVAAYGVGSRLEGLLLIAPFGLGAALTPFIGQNWGAHQNERVAQGLRLSVRFVFWWGTAAWIVLLGLAAPMAGLFTDDPEVLDHAVDYLWIVPLSYGASGVVSVASAAFNAVDRAVRSTLLSATKSLLLAVPLAFLGSYIHGIEGIFAGIAIATALSGVFAWYWLRTLTQPHTAEHMPDASRTHIRLLKKDLHAPFDELLDYAKGLEELVVRPRPINTIGFYCNGREVGHVHRTGHVDLHFPPSIGDELIREGRAEHHRAHEGTSWITHQLTTDREAEEAAWLLKLGHVLHRLCAGDNVESELDTLELSEELRGRVEKFVTKIRRHKAAA